MAVIKYAGDKYSSATCQRRDYPTDVDDCAAFPADSRSSLYG